MEEKEIIQKQIEKSLEILKKLPEDRKFFINTGVLLVEVSKKEAEAYLKKELEGLRGNTLH
ncbi:hypothetical protein [Persephonella sp.]|uniref:hypothetical protein n=1 Tax=Persephonella sp. TaxID=2060922 RepID=UPI0025D83DD8|nr:hypothetical protein [Persephonella sp.]